MDKKKFSGEPEDLIEKPILDHQISDDRKIKIQITLSLKEAMDFKMWCMNRRISLSNAFRIMFKKVKNSL